jgi:hypothetical protein
MKNSFAAALLLPSIASAHESYLRKTREVRLGRPSGFTWITEPTSIAIEIVTLPTASSTDSQLAAGTTTEIATLPATTSVTSSLLDEYTPTCTTNSDCYPKLRVQVPPSSDSLIGVSICGCYATSIINPFDECQGNTLDCSVAGCFRNSCDGTSAFCDDGVCVLLQDLSGDAVDVDSSMSMSLPLDDNVFWG